MNPGQSVKDRAALYLIRDALYAWSREGRRHHRRGDRRQHRDRPRHGWDGLSVSTASIVIPETQSREKKDTLRQLGARLIEVTGRAYATPNNFVKVSARTAERLARENPNGAFWANQFDNVANRQAHIETTGPEIWRDTDGRVDGFICAIGSGGTLAGIAMALKEKSPSVTIGCADPMGAAMYSWFTTGELKAAGSSITEGIGQGRVTKNIEARRWTSRSRFPDEGSDSRDVRPARARGPLRRGRRAE